MRAALLGPIGGARSPSLLLPRGLLLRMAPLDTSRRARGFTTGNGTSLLYPPSRPSTQVVAFMEMLRQQGTDNGSVELKRSARDDRVLELTLKNERSRNSLTGRMMVQLHDIAVELTSPASKYEDCCALLLRGEGSTFCSGADFHLAAKIGSPEQGVLMAELMTTTLTRLRYVCGLESASSGSRSCTLPILLSVHPFIHT